VISRIWTSKKEVKVNRRIRLSGNEGPRSERVRLNREERSRTDTPYFSTVLLFLHVSPSPSSSLSICSTSLIYPTHILHSISSISLFSSFVFHPLYIYLFHITTIVLHDFFWTLSRYSLSLSSFPHFTQIKFINTHRITMLLRRTENEPISLSK